MLACISKFLASKIDEANVDNSNSLEYLAIGLEHTNLEHASNCKSWPNNLKSFEIGVEENVDLGSRIKDSLLPNMVL